MLFFPVIFDGLSVMVDEQDAKYHAHCDEFDAPYDKYVSPRHFARGTPTYLTVYPDKFDGVTRQE